jgi:hypothetical protein
MWLGSSGRSREQNTKFFIEKICGLGDWRKHACETVSYISCWMGCLSTKIIACCELLLPVERLSSSVSYDTKLAVNQFWQNPDARNGTDHRTVFMYEYKYINMCVCMRVRVCVPRCVGKLVGKLMWLFISCFNSLNPWTLYPSWEASS